MLGYLTVILCCQLAGELLVAATGLPVPGPVIGMAMLFAGLLKLGELPKDLAATADGLLRNMSLLFVPGGAGIITHLSLISRDLVAISTSIIISTGLTIAITAIVMSRLAPHLEGAANADDGGENE